MTASSPKLAASPRGDHPASFEMAHSVAGPCLGHVSQTPRPEEAPTISPVVGEILYQFPAGTGVGEIPSAALSADCEQSIEDCVVVLSAAGFEVAGVGIGVGAEVVVADAEG